jgi:hypothetical protein
VVDAYGHVSVRSTGNPERYFLSCSLWRAKAKAEIAAEGADKHP